MAELSRYCPHCGAANTAESQVCFSCQQPLLEAEEEAQGILLNHFWLGSRAASQSGDRAPAVRLSRPHRSYHRAKLVA